MTATTQVTARIGGTAWYLTSIADLEGGCDHCGRTLKHLYHVVNPEGVEMTVGRGCVKKITGWTLSYAQARQMLAAAHRGAELRRRRAVVAADYPGLAAAHAEVSTACAAARTDGYDPMVGYSRVAPNVGALCDLFTEATVTDCFWGGRGWSAFGGWREYLDAYAPR